MREGAEAEASHALNMSEDEGGCGVRGQLTYMPFKIELDFESVQLDKLVIIIKNVSHQFT